MCGGGPLGRWCGDHPAQRPGDARTDAGGGAVVDWPAVRPRRRGRCSADLGPCARGRGPGLVAPAARGRPLPGGRPPRGPGRGGRGRARGPRAGGGAGAGGGGGGGGRWGRGVGGGARAWWRRRRGADGPPAVSRPLALAWGSVSLAVVAATVLLLGSVLTAPSMRWIHAEGPAVWML